VLGTVVVVDEVELVDDVELVDPDSAAAH